MIIGVGLDARLGLPFNELRELGAEAARLGFESVWTTSGGVPDAFHVCAQWSQASATVVEGGLRTGIGVIPVVQGWNPRSLALQAATVGLISNGRFVVGLGTGGYGEQFFAGCGLPNRPISVMRDYVTILRKLLRGETVNYEGRGISVKGYSLGMTPPTVGVYLAALGPQMLRLAGECADGVSLNWATPEQIAWSNALIAEGAAAAGRERSEVGTTMYIRVCVDEDVDAARRAFGQQVLDYALAKPGIDPSLAYRGHFTRMGFNEPLLAVEALRDRGASTDELIAALPDEMLHAIGYFGSAEGAAKRFATLATGLDEVIVRVITARPGVDRVLTALHALTPEKIRAVS
jgi:alkanesulfonate monooxygenase SsuD/methylene tetrahydromethanopterin reductase-like flavin-dependent oxidoreductase (luciferase family)